MCGIVGYLSPKLSPNSAAYFKMISLLLDADTVRGSDSTGVAIIPVDPTLQRKVHKNTMAGFDFVKMDDFKALEESMTSQPVLVIGHNRAATHGSVIRDNAHPFEVDNITLVHNGVVMNQDELDSGIKSDVDSHHIAGAIQKHGWEVALPKLQGSAILVWHDTKDNTLHVSRTRNRELHLAFDEHGTLWFASESLMLMWAAEKSGVKLVEPMMTPREWHHYSMPLSAPKGFSSTQIAEPPKPKWEEEQAKWKRAQAAKQNWQNKHSTSGGTSLGELAASRGAGPPTTTRHPGNTSTTTGQSSATNSQGTSNGITGTQAVTKPGLDAYVNYNAERNSFEVIPRSHAERAGRYEPRSKKKIRRMNKLLEDWGYEFGELIDVKPYGMTTVRENPTEKVINAVYTGTGEPQEVRIYNATQRTWDERDPFGNIRVIVYSMLDTIERSTKLKVLATKPWVPTLEEVVFGPNNTLIPIDIFEEVAQLGCTHCAGEIKTDTHNGVQWTIDHKARAWQMVCTPCVATHNENREKAV